MNTWALKVETRSPSGVGLAWTHSEGWSDKDEAEIEAAFMNRYFPTETINGAEHSLYWFTAKVVKG
jgi:hypothetical protein